MSLSAKIKAQYAHSPKLAAYMLAELAESEATEGDESTEYNDEDNAFVSVAHWKLESLIAEELGQTLPVVSKKYTKDETITPTTRKFYTTINELVRLRQISKGRAAAILRRFQEQLEIPRILCARMPAFLITHSDATWAEALATIWQYKYNSAGSPLHHRHHVKTDAIDIPKQATYAELHQIDKATISAVARLGLKLSNVQVVSTEGDKVVFTVAY